MIAFGSWLLYHYLRLVNFMLHFDLLEKKFFSETAFFLKSSHFCAITPILWRICLYIKLIYNFRYPIWNKIYDRHSSKTPNQELYSRSAKCSDWSWQTIKDNIWYIHDFLKEVGNNIRASYAFNAAVIACIWCFNNNIFSVITPLAFDNDNVSLIEIFRIHTWVLFATFFFFFCVEFKSGFLYQNFNLKSATC